MAKTTKCGPTRVSGKRSRSPRASSLKRLSRPKLRPPPATRQQPEAFLCLGQFDDLQLHALVARGLRSGLTRITLVSKGEFHRLAGHALNLTRELPTCPRSCSLAGVMCAASSRPSVSTAT